MMLTMVKPDIIAVLQSYGVSVREGIGWVAVKCPFHGDSNASASVNSEFGKFNCHGCDVHGDAWDLIQAHEGCTFKEAVELGKQYTESGIVVKPKENKPTKQIRGRRGRI